MSNSVKLFIDPAGDYTGGYTSETLLPTPSRHSSNQTRGVVQANVEAAASVSLQMRVSEDARWVEITVYTEDTIEEVVVSNFMRIVVTGDAKVWLGEVK